MSLKDKFEVKLKFTGTLYAYGQESAEHFLALELAGLTYKLGLRFKNLTVSVRKK